MRHYVITGMLLVALPGLAGCSGAAPVATSTGQAIAATPSMAVPPTEPPAPTRDPPTPTDESLPPPPGVTAEAATSAPGPTHTATTVSTTSVRTPTTSAGSGTWREIVAANAGPTPRSDHTAVVDPVRQQLVVFGGRDTDAVGDTWIFDLTTLVWREVLSAGPTPRFGHGAVYDAANRRMLVVMGQGAGFFNDVWAFDLDKETWTELHANDESTAAPKTRYGQSAALDGDGRLLISHGFSVGRFDDTWAFDVAARRWVDLSPARGLKPLKRCLHELNYDPTTDRLIMFGGCSSGFGPCPQGDMWAFDLTTRTWTELKPAGTMPSPRSNPSMVYAPDRQQIVLFGGLTGQGSSAEMWRYDLATNTWTRVGTTQGPSARSSQSMSYDGAKGRVLLFGGKTGDTNSMEIWEWQF